MKAAIYCRLSEEDKNKLGAQDDSGSIQNQKMLLQQYAAEQGWEIFDVYSDDDRTGADRRRPEFNRLLRDAAEKKFDIILCKTQSRFTRELELVEKYIHGLFPRWGIRFISIVDNGDTANAGNKKSRQINGLINEWYLEDLSENIRSVLDHRRKNGLHIGSFALYGYKKDAEQKGRILIDEEAAVVVREIFQLYAEGWGKTAIARRLNERGIPSPAEYKRRQGLRYQPSKSGGLWKYSTVAAMLQNEIYIGNMVQGKYGSLSYKSKENRPRPKSQWFVVENTHEAIIARDLWERVQRQLAERSKPFSSGKRGIFAGKVRCVSCGCVLRSSKNRGRYYLQCATRFVSKSSCEGAFLSVAKLEEVVLEQLNRMAGECLDKEQLKQADFCRGRERLRLTEEMELCGKRAEDCSRRIRQLYKDRLNGLLEERDFAALAEELSGERSRLERQREELKNRINLQKDSMEEPSCQLPFLSRDAVELFIDHISVGKRIPGTRIVPMEIHWNF